MHHTACTQKPIARALVHLTQPASPFGMVSHRLTALEELRLTGNMLFGDWELEPLACCISLRTVDLGGCDLQCAPQVCGSSG